MSTVDEIKQRLDIVDTVSGYVSLRKSGRTLKGLCPFHTEKTPSFIVSPDRQSWRCFGACATGGDVISFVMRAERLEFGGAIRTLAQKAGVEIAPKADRDRSEGIYTINQEAVRYFQELLAGGEGESARRYLEERGVDSAAASMFQLGLSPAGSTRLKDHLTGLGFLIDQAVDAGLVRRNEAGSTRDFFYGRLMFPIHDRQGRVAGFGARSLDGAPPKYLNTPATRVFDKRGTLYGLHLAGSAIKAQKTGIVVEGYMDVIAAHQAGYENVVASMGTALTEQQVAQVKPLASSFVLALDPDTAGQEAIFRSLEASWHTVGAQRPAMTHPRMGPLHPRRDFTLTIAALPAGADPDTLIRKDIKEWERLIADAVPLFDHIIGEIPKRFDLTSAAGKAEAAEFIAPLIFKPQTDLEQYEYLEKLAKALDVSVDALKASIGRPRGRTGPRARRGYAAPDKGGASLSALSPERREAVEDYALALLLNRPELRERVKDFAPENFGSSEYREVFTTWLKCTTIDRLRDSLDRTLHDRLDRLIQLELAPADRPTAEAALAQCLGRLEERHLQELQESLLATDDASLPPHRDLEEPISAVNTRLKELFHGRGAIPPEAR